MPSPDLQTLIHRADNRNDTTACGMPLEVRDGITNQLIMRRKTSAGVITCPRCKGIES